MPDFEKARLKYKPALVKILFIAEAPPKAGSERFFYFETVNKHDSLFLETMKCIYPQEISTHSTPEIRKKKKYFLEKFKSDGFYLIDSLDQPFDRKLSSKQKELFIKEGQIYLLDKIKILCNKNTKVILLAAPVFNANFTYLTTNGIDVVNKTFIEFPGSGGQPKFRAKVAYLLNSIWEISR